MEERFVDRKAGFLVHHDLAGRADPAHAGMPLQRFMDEWDPTLTG